MKTDLVALILFLRHLPAFIRWAERVIKSAQDAGRDGVITFDEACEGMRAAWAKRDANDNPLPIKVPELRWPWGKKP